MHSRWTIRFRATAWLMAAAVLLPCWVPARSWGADAAGTGRGAVFPPVAPATAPVLVPMLNLTNVEQVVIRQFKDAREVVDKLVAGKAEPLKLAEGWGQLGKTFAAYRVLTLGAACFTNALVALPTHAPSWYGLAACRIELEQKSDALAAVRNARACQMADPATPPSDLGETRRLMGDILDRMGRLDEALETFEAEHLGEPPETYSAIRSIQILLRLGRASEANERLEPIAKAMPRNRVVRAFVAESYERMGDKQKAAAMRSGISGAELPPIQRPDAWWSSVMALNRSSGATAQEAGELMRAGRFQAALRKWKLVLATHPTNSEARVQLGTCQLRVKDFAAARTTFAALVQDVPQNQVARAGLAVSLARIGDRPKAYEVCRQWLAAEPGSVAALFTDSEVRRAFKDFEGAEKTLRVLVEMEPLNPGNKRALANTLHAVGKGREALAMQIDFVRKNPLADDVALQVARALAASRDKSVRNPAAALASIPGLLVRGTNLPLIETQAIAFGGIGRWDRAEAALKSVQAQFDALVMARSGIEGEPAEEDESITRFRAVQRAVSRKVDYLEPWPFANPSEVGIK